MELNHAVVVVVQMTWGEPEYISLTVVVRCRMFLQFLDTILPVNPIEVIPEDASGVG